MRVFASVLVLAFATSPASLDAVQRQLDAAWSIADTQPGVADL